MLSQIEVERMRDIVKLDCLRRATVEQCKVTSLNLVITHLYEDTIIAFRQVGGQRQRHMLARGTVLRGTDRRVVWIKCHLTLFDNPLY